MVELPVTVYEQNNEKGVVVVFTTILLVTTFLISGLQLNHASSTVCFVIVYCGTAQLPQNLLFLLLLLSMTGLNNQYALLPWAMGQ